MERVPHEEFLRFALLVVLTIALASVAFRIDTHPSARHRAERQHPLPPASAGRPHVLPTTATRQPSVPSVPSGGGTGGMTPVAATESAQPVLPVTGWDGAVRLVALGVVLVAGGASLRTAGARQRG